MTKVGFIGLGDQGGPMAVAIAEAGHELHAWARREASFNAIAGAKCVRHAELSSLVRDVEIVALCLRDDGDVWQILDEQGLRGQLRRGQLLVNHGTGDPGENRRIAASLDSIGVVFLDAPVSGGRPGAVTRSLTTLIGGPSEAVARCRPTFESFSSMVAHMGPIGMGQTTKLLNNALTMTNLKNAVDVFDFAASIGIDIPRLQEVILASSGASAILKAIGAQIDIPAAEHLQGLMRKDIEHFADAMRSLKLDPDSVRARGLAGADGLVMLTERIVGRR